MDIYGTDPTNPDTDGDTYSDGQEAEYETSGTSAEEFPKGEYVGGASCSSTEQTPTGFLALFGSVLGMLGLRRRKERITSKK